MRGACVASPGETRVLLLEGTSSIYRGGSTGDASLGLSVQTLRSRIHIGIGVVEDLELGLELSLVRVERSWKNDDGCRLYVRYEDTIVADIDSTTLGAANPAFRASFLFIDASDDLVPRLAATAVFTFPLGADRTYSRPDGVEFGLFLDAAWSFLAPFHFHMTLGWVLGPSLPDLAGGPALDLENQVFGGFEAQWRPAEAVALHVQFIALRNPFPRTGNYRLDDPPVQVTAGVSVLPSCGLRLFLTFSEDLSRLAPDFGIELGMELVLS
jgi:hypothetical protein